MAFGRIVQERKKFRLHFALYLLDADPARDFAPGVSAHAVGNNQKSDAVIDKHRILVAGADPTDIGLSYGMELELHGSPGIIPLEIH